MNKRFVCRSREEAALKFQPAQMGTKFLLVLLLLVTGLANAAFSQQEPWKPAQMMAPSELAAALKLPAGQRPIVIDVGPAGVIKGALVAGPAHESDGMKQLKTLLQKIDKKAVVVIYCGCCPFAKCPNVRPAFKMLLALGFKDPRLLDLRDNLKADWIDRGYPLEQDR